MSETSGGAAEDIRLAWQLVERYESTGDPAALERAAEHLHALLAAGRPADDGDRTELADVRYLLGGVELYRAQARAAAGQPVESHVDAAVEHLTVALGANPDADWAPDARRRLGDAYAHRAWTGDAEAFDHAIECFRAAPLSDGDAALALLLVERWPSWRDPADLDEAIGHLERVPDTDLFLRHALGLALAHRWEHEGARADLDRAVDLFADGPLHPPFALAHARLRHERAMRDGDDAELATAIALLTDLASDPRMADDPVVHAELGFARWNRFRRTGDVAEREAAAAALTEALQRPGLDANAAQAIDTLRAVAWAIGPEAPGLAPDEQAQRRQALQTSFQSVINGFFTGTVFPPADRQAASLSPDAPLPARYAGLVDEQMVTDHWRKTLTESDAFGPDHPHRPMATIMQALLNTISRLLRAGPQQARSESVEMLTDLYAAAADPRTRSIARRLLATALLIRGIQGGGNSDIEAAVEHLQAMLGGTPRDEQMHRHLRKAFAGALYARFSVRGDLHDLEEARDIMQEIVDTGDEDPPIETLMMRATLAEITEAWAVRTGDRAAAARAVTDLERIVAELPPDHPGTKESRANLDLLRGKFTFDAAALPQAAPSPIGALIDEAHAGYGSDRERAIALLRAAQAMLVNRPDEPSLRAAAAYARQSLLLADPESTVFPRHAIALGWALHGLVGYDGDQAHISEAMEWLSRAIDSARDPSRPEWCTLHILLGLFHRMRGRPADRVRSRELGTLGLRGNRWQVLLQSSVERAMAVATKSLSDVAEVAGWCLNDGAADDAVAVLDAGRGAILHSATATVDMPALLEAVGEAGLAARWRASAGTDIDRDLRYATMKALAGADRMLDPPPVEEIQHALRATGTDSLVYLTAGTKPGVGGAAVIVAADAAPAILWLPSLTDTEHGPIERYVRSYDAYRAAPQAYGRWREALGALLDWAGRAAVGPLVARRAGRWRPRIVLVPMGRLALVPWHAARLGGEYAVARATWSYAASARLFVEVAARPPVPPDAESLIVGDPDNSLWFAGREALAIREAFYPDARYLGQPPTVADGPGVPAEMLDWLAGGDRHTLHLACHGVAQEGTADTSYLTLAGGQRLTAEELIEVASAGGLGLVSLAACTTHLSTRGYDEAFSLATAFLVAGARAAVGSLWRVPDQATSLLMFMTHYYLRHDRLDPAEALSRAQAWMIDPARRAVSQMPPDLVSLADAPELADPVAWAGFTHVGT